MLLTVDGTNRIAERAALRSMFAARKQVFIDLLKWDLPALDGKYEIDQFDDGYAHYIILLDEAGEHLGSARLLPTTRPALLDTLFPELCEGPTPAGPDIFEITRFCLSRRLRAARRHEVRNELVTALVQFARPRGITTYTGVAEKAWRDQILAFGWDCRPLGATRRIGDAILGAICIEIADDTITRLEANGIHATPDTQPLHHAA